MIRWFDSSDTRRRAVPVAAETHRSPGRMSCVRDCNWTIGAFLACCAVMALCVVWAEPASAKLTHARIASFGSFNNVQGIAVDQASEDVYVYDSGAKAIYKFNATGNPENFSFTKSPEIEGLPESGYGQGEIAVDSSTGPAKGDIYLATGSETSVLVFDSAGEQVGELTGETGVPWGPTCGVAVGPTGNVYVDVYGSERGINKYVPTANPVTNADYVQSLEGLYYPCNIAVDSSENLMAEQYPSGISLFEPTEFGSTSAIGRVIDKSGYTVAVDPANDDVYVDEANAISQFGPHGQPFEEPVAAFARSGEEGEIEASYGIALNETNEHIYASSGKGAVNMFGPLIVVPDVTTGAASAVGSYKATLNGTVNPDGEGAATCQFVWGTTTSLKETVPCVASVANGTSPVPAEAALTDLEPDTTYYYRLQARNANGSNIGEPAQTMQFRTLGVGLHGESVLNVSSTSATLQATLDPNDAPTSYHFDYGTTESYGLQAPSSGERSIGEAAGDVEALQHVQGLAPNTTYHYRVVAASEVGTGKTETFYGPDQTFVTQDGGGMLTLLDGRQWQLVSPPNKYGGGLMPKPFEGGVIEASASGNAISYLAQNPVELEPEGNRAPEPAQVLAKRNATGGWKNTTITTKNDESAGVALGDGSEYRMFSSDLSSALLEPHSATALAPTATERTQYLRNDAACEEHSTGCFTPLVTPADTADGAKWDPYPLRTLTSEEKLVTATPDLKHVLLHSNVQLTEGGPEKGLYEWSEGQLRVVSITPEAEGGTPVDGEVSYEDYNDRNAISNDGNRIFWGEPAGYYQTGPLMMRDMARGETIRLDSAGDRERAFEIATNDGERAFFTEGNAEGKTTLDVCIIAEVAGRLKCEREEIAPQPIGMVIGIDEPGDIVYYVSSAALTTGAEEGADNLYVSHRQAGEWKTHLIGVLSAEDAPDWGFGGYSALRFLSSRVSADGRYLAFMSRRSLTGYDNRDAVSGEPDEEVFLYDEATGNLTCASCNPTGARPQGLRVRNSAWPPPVDSQRIWTGTWLGGSVPGWSNLSLLVAQYQPRYLDNEGRLFFNSSDALVSQDTNGLVDVYEYEPADVGSCAKSAGCRNLISSGTSGEESVFLDASESGNDVFFLTSSRLTSDDVDTAMDVYDAHVCTATTPCTQAPVTPPPCMSGESCKPAPTPQPVIFGPPPSATFMGAGNLTSGVHSKRSRKHKRVARRRMPRVTLKHCRGSRKQNMHERNACARRTSGRAKRSTAHKASNHGGHRRTDGTRRNGQHRRGR